VMAAMNTIEGPSGRFEPCDDFFAGHLDKDRSILIYTQRSVGTRAKP
jgi:hypothetical protein